MKRTTSLIATGALGLGASVLLGTVAPGVASASGCGETAVDQNTLATTFGSGYGETTGKATAVMEGGGLHLTTAKKGATSAHFMDVEGGLRLAGTTAQSNFALDATIVDGDVKRGATYELVVDLDGVLENNEDLTWLVYEGRYQERRPDTWWSSLPMEAIADRKGHGSPDFGTLAEISQAYPDAVITSFGFAVGPGQLNADVVVHGITVGCNTFRFAYTNQAPTAVLDVVNEEHQTFWFTGAASADVDGQVVSYSWDFGDGSAPGEGAEVQHSFPGLGTYTVALTVTDDSGNQSIASRQVRVRSMATTVNDQPLPNTGADVLGLAALGGLVLAGGSAGLVASRRLKAGTQA